MQKWEYSAYELNGNFRLYTTDGVKSNEIRQDNSKGHKSNQDARARFVAELGLEGWELVAVLQRVGFEDWHFKRPLPE